MIVDSLLLHVLTKEWRAALLFSQVREIHQTDARVFCLDLFAPSRAAQTLVLALQHPPCVYAAPAKEKQTYIAAQNFCMTLRKHLEGARLSDISQISMDRILCFSFDRIETGGAIVTKKLYTELIPSAPNLVLTEDGHILDTLIRGKKQHRDLAPGTTYELPAGTDRLNFLQFTETELAEIFSYGKQDDAALSDWLFSEFNGLSAALVAEIARRSALDIKIPMNRLSGDDISRLAAAFSSVRKDVESADGLFLYPKGNGESASVFPLPGAEGRHISSISAWLAEQMKKDGGAVSASIQELKKHIKNLIKKEERKLRKIEEELEETKLLETYNLYGQILAIYSYMKPTAPEMTVANPFDETGTEITIPVDPSVSVIRNSQLYFKKYNKMKTRVAIGQEKRDECQMRLDYLENAAYFAENVRDRNALESLRAELRDIGVNPRKQLQQKTKQKKSAPEEPETRTIDGYTVFIGKNSRQNEYLTLRKAQKTDLWLHAKEIPGSHVVIATDGAPIPETVIEKAAALAAYHSQARHDGKVSVDATKVQYVKKIPNAPAGLVSYTHHTTYVVAPDDPSSAGR